MKKAKKVRIDRRVTLRGFQALQKDRDGLEDRLRKAEDDLRREHERRMRLEEEARAARQVLITEGSPFTGSLVELAHYVMGTYAPVQQRALKVLQLGNDLRDAGRRIVELEGQVKCRTYEDWLLTQELDRAGAPAAKTPVERLQGLLRGLGKPAGLWRVRSTARDVAWDALWDTPLRTLDATQTRMRSVVEHLGHCQGIYETWLECSDDAGGTWRRCNEKGEVIA